MKYPYLCTLAAMALFMSCHKNDVDNPLPPNEWLNDSTTVSFPSDRVGLTELYETSVEHTPTFIVSKAKPNQSFDYSLVGSNGMKRSTDTTVMGSGVTDSTGYAALSLPGLNNYKDGEITVVVQIADPKKTLTFKFQKAELEIRNYKDFMHMGFYTADTSCHYVQLNDFAFPDTTFTAPPASVAQRGSYDGQGHKITNLTIKRKGAAPNVSNHAALFLSVVNGGTIKNVRLELSEEGITCDGNGLIGGLVAITDENTSLINCSVKGNVLAPKDAVTAYAGGITAVAWNAKIIGCSFRGKVSANFAGGITSTTVNNVAIDMCYAFVEFDGNSGGGIVSVVTDTVENTHVTISNSYVFAIATAARFEAIAPLDSRVTITSCFANTGNPQSGVTIAALPSMNTALSAMEITNWPQGVPHPANNKPYKTDMDPSVPMKLWWE